SLAGIFFSSHILPRLAAKGSGESLLRIPLISKAEMQQRKERETRMAELEKEAEKIQDDEISAFAKNALPQTADYLGASWNQSDKASGGVSISSPLVRGEDKGEGSPSTSPQPSQTAEAHLLNPTLLQRWMNYFATGHLGLFTKALPNLMDKKGLNVWRN